MDGEWQLSDLRARFLPDIALSIYRSYIGPVFCASSGSFCVRDVRRRPVARPASHDWYTSP